MFSFGLAVNTDHYLLVKQRLSGESSISDFNVKNRTLHAKYMGVIDSILATVFACLAVLGLSGTLPIGVGIAFAIVGGGHLLLGLVSIPISIKKERTAQRIKIEILGY